MQQPSPGYCAETTFSGNCTTSSLGWWPTYKHRIRSMDDCAAMCRRCERCAYVSLSLAPANSDCSWFARCDMENLLMPPPESGYKSLRVKPEPPPLRAHHRAAKVAQRRAWRVAVVGIAIGGSTKCGLVA
eukprot:1936424-Prymnesium_polylepis.1